MPDENENYEYNLEDESPYDPYGEIVNYATPTGEFLVFPSQEERLKELQEAVGTPKQGERTSASWAGAVGGPLNLTTMEQINRINRTIARTNAHARQVHEDGLAKMREFNRQVQDINDTYEGKSPLSTGEQRANSIYSHVSPMGAFAVGLSQKEEPMYDPRHEQKFLPQKDPAYARGAASFTRSLNRPPASVTSKSTLPDMLITTPDPADPGRTRNLALEDRGAEEILNHVASLHTINNVISGNTAALIKQEKQQEWGEVYTDWTLKLKNGTIPYAEYCRRNGLPVDALDLWGAIRFQAWVNKKEGNTETAWGGRMTELRKRDTNVDNWKNLIVDAGDFYEKSANGNFIYKDANGNAVEAGPNEVLADKELILKSVNSFASLAKRFHNLAYNFLKMNNRLDGNFTQDKANFRNTANHPSGQTFIDKAASAAVAKYLNYFYMQKNTGRGFEPLFSTVQKY